MERDFLGLVRKESPPASTRMACDDAAGLRKSASQWPFSSKTPPYVPLKTIPSEGNHFLLPGFHPASDTIAADLKRNSSPVLMTQRSVNADGNDYICYAGHGQQMRSAAHIIAPNRQLNGLRSFPIVGLKPVQSAAGNASMKVHNYPNQQSGSKVPLLHHPYVGINTSNGTIASFGHRTVPKPLEKSAQLTIFYAGSVNVFDDVSSDKAHQILLLASKASQVPLSRTHRSEAYLPSAAKEVADSGVVMTRQTTTEKPDFVLPPTSAVPSTGPVASPNGTLSRSASSLNTENLSPNVASTVALSSSQPTPTSSPPILAQPAIMKPHSSSGETSAAVIPGAVPLARKASLARFLAKRKERVATAAPYSYSIKSADNSDTHANSTVRNKSFSMDVNLQNNGDKSSLSNQTEITSNGRESLSTKLQI